MISLMNPFYLDSVKNYDSRLSLDKTSYSSTKSISSTWNISMNGGNVEVQATSFDGKFTVAVARGGSQQEGELSLFIIQ